MPAETLVDLLLVRLRGEQDQDAVRRMLVDVLGMTEEEASASVASTPLLLSKCLPMEEARVIQEKMYPYIDLLPREYGSQESTASRAGSGAARECVDEGTYVHEPDAGPLAVQRVSGEPETDPGEPEGGPEDAPADEPLIITSASEEMLTVDRCHVCGRTPTTDEKLAPCRTCGALTCSDCFDRFVHVCSKCAADGLMVDRPIKGKPEYRKRDEVEEAPVEEPVAPKRKVNPALIAVLLVAVLAAAFYFLDPLALFGPGDDGSQPAASAASPDTTVSDGEPIPTDSLAAAPDTTTADSLQGGVPDSLGTVAGDSLADDGGKTLAELSLPEDMEVPAELAMPVLLLTSPVTGLETLPDSIALISQDLSCLLSSSSIQSEGVTMVRAPGGEEMLLLSILHPEPVEERSRLIGSLGLFLDGSCVDQMVIYYRESPYYSPEILSFVADSFEVIAGAIGPGVVQSRQAGLPATWELVSEPILDWMTHLG